MTYTENQGIGEKGQNIFTACLSSSWVAQRLNPDYHIDYRVEIFCSNEPCGLRFLAQIRSQKTLRCVDNKYYALPLETKHVKYYYEQREPVFLVAVDLASGACYYLFIQEYVEKKLSNKNWSKQRKVTVHIPRENVVTRVDQFKEAVHRATVFTSNLHPGSIEAAIAKKKKDLEALDNRFSVDISVSGRNIIHYFSPRESIAATLSVSAEISRLREIDNALRVGLPVKISGKEILSFAGSPLFDSLKISEFKVEPLVSEDMHMNLSAYSSSGTVAVQINHIPVVISRGSHGMSFWSTDKNLPVKIEDIVQKSKRDGTEEETSLRIKFNFDFTVWKGWPFRSLPYYGEMRVFYPLLESGARVKVEVVSKKGVGTLSSKPRQARSAECQGFLDIVEKAVHVAEHLQSDVKFIDLTNRKIREILQAYDLLLGTEHTFVSEGLTLSLPLSADSAVNLLDSIENNRDGTLGLRPHDAQTFSFLGQQYLVDELRYEFKEVSLKNEYEVKAGIAAVNTPDAITFLFEVPRGAPVRIVRDG